MAIDMEFGIDIGIIYIHRSKDTFIRFSALHFLIHIP
jgi:hypothetical protein